MKFHYQLKYFLQIHSNMYPMNFQIFFYMFYTCNKIFFYIFDSFLKLFPVCKSISETLLYIFCIYFSCKLLSILYINKQNERNKQFYIKNTIYRIYIENEMTFLLKSKTYWRTLLEEQNKIYCMNFYSIFISVIYYFTNNPTKVKIVFEMNNKNKQRFC